MTRSRCEHVIWDWNGTLFDDAWLCVDVMNHLLAKRGLPALTRERYERIFDFPVIRYYERLGFDFDRDPFEKVGLEFIELYQERRWEARLQAEAWAVLSTLTQMGLRQSVLSAYQHDALEEILAAFHVRACFDHVLGIEDHYAAGKVEQGQALMSRLTSPPEAVVLIGDTLHDAEVAAALGVRCWLIPSGNQARDKLLESGVPVLSSLGEVPDRLVAGGRHAKSRGFSEER